MLRRIIPLVVVMALVVPLLLFPASAASNQILDYNDFITNMTVDGDNDLVTIVIPVEYGLISVLESSIDPDNSYHVIGSYENGVCQLALKGGLDWKYGFYFYFLSKGNYLDISNIPEGTQYSLTVSVSASSEMARQPYYIVSNYYCDANKQVLYEQSTVLDNNDIHMNSPQTVFSSLEKKDGAALVSPRVYWKHLQFIDEGVNVTLTMQPLVMQTSISSLYRLQEQTGKTNEILSAVEKKLEENGQKLDDVISGIENNGEKLDDVISGIEDNGEKLDEIINGEVEPERPEGADSIDDLGKLEEDLLGSAADGMEDYDIFIDDSLSFIENHVQGFALMSIVFDSFFGVGWLHGIFVISLSLGIFGYLVNIAFKAAGDARSKASRAGKGGKGS